MFLEPEGSKSSCFSGDIKDLFNIKLEPGHAAAFATDCDLPSTHEMVRSIGMQVGFLVSFQLVAFSQWQQRYILSPLDNLHGLPGL